MLVVRGFVSVCVCVCVRFPGQWFGVRVWRCANDNTPPRFLKSLLGLHFPGFTVAGRRLHANELCRSCGSARSLLFFFFFFFRLIETTCL